MIRKDGIEQKKLDFPVLRSYRHELQDGVVLAAYNIVRMRIGIFSALIRTKQLYPVYVVLIGNCKGKGFARLIDVGFLEG